MADVATINLPAATVADEVLVNQTSEGVNDVKRIPMVSFSQQLASIPEFLSLLAGNTNTVTFYETEAEFEAASIPAVTMSVAVKGYASSNDGGGHTKKRIPAPATPGPQHKQSADGAWWVIADHQDVRPEMLGADADGSDDVTKIQDAIEAAYAIKARALVFSAGKTYGVSDQIFFNGYPGENGLDTGLTVFAYGATIKLLSNTSPGHVIGIGRGAYTAEKDQAELTGNLRWLFGTIDVNDISGENGFGLARAINVTIDGVKVMNGSFSASIEGGRAFTAHALCRDVIFRNCYAYKMGDGFHFANVPDTRSDIGGTDLYNISAISKAAQAVITTTVAHNIAVGEDVFVGQVTGMTEINPSYSNESRHKVLAATATTLTIDLDTTSYSNYTSSGFVVRADDQHFRNWNISIVNCRAEECTWSGLALESDNQPPSTSLLSHNVVVDGLTLINCGSNTTDRGIINGNNASGARLRNVVVHNNDNFPVSDVIRGPWQNSQIDIDVDVASCRSIVNASPIVGDEPSTIQYPYVINHNNRFKLRVNASRTLTGSVIASSDRVGSSIDYQYRNEYDVVLYGVEGGITHALMDVYTKASQSWVRFTDLGNNQVVEGSSDAIDLAAPFEGTVRKIGEHRFDELVANGTASNIARIKLDAKAGANTSRVEALLNGVSAATIDFRHGNSRWYVSFGGADKWQFTTTGILPGADNTQDFASAGLRGRTAYFGTGTINTSDRDTKDLIEDIPDEWLDAWGDVPCKRFKFKDAIEKKGDQARWHVGRIAQDIHEAFEARGLNAFEIGLLCFDEWEEEWVDVLDEKGTPTGVQKLVVEAGSRWSIRPDECEAMEDAWKRREIARQAQEIEGLKAMLH